MMRKFLLMSAVLLTVSSAQGSLKEDFLSSKVDGIAEGKGYSLGLGVSTLGVAIDASKYVNDSLSVRGNLNTFSYTHTGEMDDIEYEGELTLFTLGVLADYYPSDTAFRLTAGLYYNGNKFEGIAKPSSTYSVNGENRIEINGKKYGSDEVGQLETSLEMNKVSPYIGIGWGNDTREKGWGFSFDIGVMYHGEPTSTVNVVFAEDFNNIGEKLKIKENVVAEKASLEDELAPYKFYPVVAFGINYTF